MAFYLQLRCSEVAAFAEQPGIVVSKSNGGFHVEFRVDHPNLVLHLRLKPVVHSDLRI